MASEIILSALPHISQVPFMPSELNIALGSNITSAIGSICSGVNGVLAFGLAGCTVFAVISYLSYANYSKSKLPAWLTGTLVFAISAIASAYWGVSSYLAASASC